MKYRKLVLQSWYKYCASACLCLGVCTQLSQQLVFQAPDDACVANRGRRSAVWVCVPVILRLKLLLICVVILLRGAHTLEEAQLGEGGKGKTGQSVAEPVEKH